MCAFSSVVSCEDQMNLDALKRFSWSHYKGAKMYLKLLLIDVVIVHVVSVTRLLARRHLGARCATLQSFTG